MPEFFFKEGAKLLETFSLAGILIILAVVLVIALLIWKIWKGQKDSHEAIKGDVDASLTKVKEGVAESLKEVNRETKGWRDGFEDNFWKRRKEEREADQRQLKRIGDNSEKAAGELTKVRERLTAIETLQGQDEKIFANHEKRIKDVEGGLAGVKSDVAEVRGVVDGLKESRPSRSKQGTRTRKSKS